jgi:general secretion pathway protein D
VTRLLAIGCAVLFAGFLVGPAAAEGPRTPETGVVNFTFDQVEVQAFVKLVGEMTGKRFVVGDGIEGKITVVSPAVRHDEIYPLFLSILETVGCSVLEDGEILRIVSLGSRPTALGPVVGPNSKTPAHGVITKVISLKHVSASELKKVLESKGGDGKMGGVSAIDDTNQLIITDTAESIRRIEALVAEIDLPGMARVTEVISLSYASAGDMAGQLNDALVEHATRAEQLRKRLGATPGTGTGSENRTASVVAAPHSNSLIVVGTVSQVESLRTLVEKMDVDVPSGRGRLNAIFLHHISAEEAAENINALLSQKGTAKETSTVVRNIAIQASPSSNALLVDANPGDFEVVKRLIDQLDVAPEQVHINVLIMEVSNSEGLQLGVQFAAVDMPSGVGDSVVQGGFNLGDSSSLLSSIQSGIFPSGMSIGIAQGTSLASDGTVQVGYPGLLNIDAQKQRGHFKVVSETSLQTQNNIEASVSVVSEIPILKSSIAGGTGSSRDVIQNIERMDVGVKLKITPHVIPGGRVRMELKPSIEAVTDDGPDGTQFAPTIARREVETTVTVADGRTIVIAGLTRQDELESVQRVPILGSIPLLGWIFRRKQTSHERTDVLIFVTPTVVSDLASADAIRAHWEEKTGLEKDGD